MASKHFYSPELAAAYEYLDKIIAEERTSRGKSDNHKGYISQLRTIRNSLEEADIAIDENRGGVLT